MVCGAIILMKLEKSACRCDINNNYSTLVKWEQAKGSPKIEGLRAQAEMRYVYIRPRIKTRHNKVLDLAEIYPQTLTPS